MSAPQIQYPPTSGGGTPVGGTGTSGTIPVWTGATPSTTLGDSLLSQSGAIVTNSGTFRTDDGAATGPGYAFANSSGTGMYRGASGTILRFAASGAFAFGVSSSQNVLIGGSATTTPGRKLTVENNQPLRLGTATEYWDFLQYTTNVWAWLSNAGQYSIFLDNSNGNAGVGTAGAPAAKFHVNGNLVTASGTTGMTSGFTYLPGAAGAPTGVPTAITGRVPMYYDTTNNQFYVYNGAWKKVTLA